MGWKFEPTGYTYDIYSQLLAFEMTLMTFCGIIMFQDKDCKWGALKWNGKNTINVKYKWTGIYLQVHT